MTDTAVVPVTGIGVAAPTAMVFVSDRASEDLLRQALSDVGVRGAKFTKGTVQTATAVLVATPRLLIVDISGLQNPLARIEELAAKCEPEVNDRGDRRSKTTLFFTASSKTPASPSTSLSRWCSTRSNATAITF